MLYGHNKCVQSILNIKERYIMISGSSDKTFRLWNMSANKCITLIKCCDTNGLYQTDKINSGVISIFSTVNIDKCIIEKTIIDESFECVFCFLKLRNTILCGCVDGLL